MLSPRKPDSRSGEAGPQLRLCDHELLPLAEGALWWPSQQTLVVSDLHLEKGVSYARGGQYLPPYDTLATLAIVRRLMQDFPVKRVISLGDSFHTPRAADALGEEIADRVREMTSACEWIWVEGNHDPDPPATLGGIAAKELRIGRLVFRHEPSGELGEIAGHLHPCARIAGRGGRSLRRRCFVTNGRALVLPAMGAFTGGLNVLDPAFEPVLGETRQVLMMGEARLYAVRADRLLAERSSARQWRL